MIIHLFSSSEFSRPVSSMCENQDGLYHRSISEQRRLHSPSVDEQETELEPSVEQEEEEGQEKEQEEDEDGNISPSRKKEIMVKKSKKPKHLLWISTDMMISSKKVKSILWG